MSTMATQILQQHHPVATSNDSAAFAAPAEEGVLRLNNKDPLPNTNTSAPSSGLNPQPVTGLEALAEPTSLSFKQEEATGTPELSHEYYASTPSTTWVAAGSSRDDSDDSDTDDEEVYQWACRMFGIQAVDQQQRVGANAVTESASGESSAAGARLTTAKTTPLDQYLPPTAEFDNSLLYDATVHIPISEKVKMRRRSCKAVETNKVVAPSDSSSAVVSVSSASSSAAGRKKKRKRGSSIQPKEAATGNSDAEAAAAAAALQKDREEEQKRQKEARKILSAAEIRDILGDEADDFVDDASSSLMGCGRSSGSSNNWVRRSVRRPCQSALQSPNVKALLDKLKNNDTDMVVLKLKKYVNDPNAPQAVMDAVLEALEENTNCEALYIQNFNEGMRDDQVLHLLKVLQRPTCRIWCLNIGETYKVKTKSWEKFAKGLADTNVTHMYASEHTITPQLKDLIRSTIRNNRSKHNWHKDPDNLHVIVQCTHCWWNPINTKSLQPYLKKRGCEHLLQDAQAQGLRGSTTGATLTESANLAGC